MVKFKRFNKNKFIYSIFLLKKELMELKLVVHKHLTKNIS